LILLCETLRPLRCKIVGFVIMTEIYQSTLEAMKAKGQVMDVLPILDDELAQKVLIAWQRIIVTRAKPSDPLPESDNAAWQWLWSGVEYDAQELAAVAGIHIQMVRPKIEQLKGNHLIFPDGSIAEYAAKLLTAKTHEYIRQMKAS